MCTLKVQNYVPWIYRIVYIFWKFAYIEFIEFCKFYEKVVYNEYSKLCTFHENCIHFIKIVYIL